MTGKIASRLASLGLALPQTPKPAGAYVGWAVVGDLVFLAGQVPIEGGVRKFIGKLGREFGVDDGKRAAQLAALNMLAQLRAACGSDLDRVVRCVRLVGYVNATESFTDHPQVVDGASDLLHRIFDEAGAHVRSSVGVGSLPSGVAVEIEGVFQISAPGTFP
ncbi:MAG TPA: RidA family protein [Ramlibacter sp.]|uniref:RidA family protein n=1 Tax=Ramlibacter sp. TaxID=1917967 RepID=UPI002CB1489F|nr:RidA family protein [Ramlibacter sp.]HVZ44246.1 RidA family protein [Ramlibacter sp.]